MNISISETTRLWEKALKKIEERINDQKTFDSFFANTYINDINNGVISIVTESEVSKILLKGQYIDLIKDVISEISDETFDFKFFTAEEVVKTSATRITSEPSISSTVFFKDSKLNPSLTFNNYVVGDFNKEAHQAALYVAQHDGNLFNPLFLYSHAGLGKTHLLHAIGNEILRTRMPNAKILYVNADDIVKEYVRFVTEGSNGQTMESFFKGVDILLLDDVQMLKEKVKTEEMFFYIYNDLINRGKRIIITSDRQPSELKGLEERLVSRFSQGLTVKIGEIDKNSCIEILKSKIIQSGFDVDKIDPSVLFFLADKFSKDVRELEGVVNSLIYYSMFVKKVDMITMDVAIEAIGSLKGGKAVANQLNEQKIINVVCDYYNVTPTQVTGKIRTGQIALARHISMYLIRNNLDVPLKKIGEIFGGKDHTTVMSAITKVDKELKTDEQLKTAIQELNKKIRE